MTSRRFGGAHGNFSFAAEHGFDRFQFGKVANWRRSGMGVEMLDITWLEAGLPQGAFHRATRAVAVLGSRRDVVGISSRAIAGDFGDWLGSSAECVFQLFNDEDTRTFAHDEAVAAAVKGAGRTRWRFVK